MGYKSILTIVTDPEAQKAQVDAAISLARREDAHLDVICLGVDMSQTGYYYAGAATVLTTDFIERAQDEVTQAEEKLRARLEAEDIRWSLDGAVAQPGALGTLVADHARFSDLVVLRKPYGEGRRAEEEAVIEAALFSGGAPVLVTPSSGLPEPFARRILLAWNQGHESLRAARAALPFLKAADAVDITVIDPPSNGPERSDPGGPLSQMLARHGVKPEVSVLARTMPRTSDVISRHVRDMGADLIVMGAYGHSRLREAILGGTTRNMLEMAEVPVFMAH